MQLDEEVLTQILKDIEHLDQNQQTKMIFNTTVKNMKFVIYDVEG